MDGIGAGAVSIGALLAYSGVKGTGILAAIHGAIAGKPPSQLPEIHQLDQPANTTIPATSGQSNQNASIALDFLTYAGRVPYVWGGASPAGWDCSGSCNYVICNDNNHAIPGYRGGEFHGQSHGPSTLGWLAWAPSNMQRLSRQDVLIGDIVLWQTHMGVATDSQNYISAYDHQEGTVKKPIDTGGPFAEVATYWRLR